MLDFFTPPPEVPGLALRAAVALAFTAIAAYYDAFNRKWVPNWVAYGFLAAAFALNLIYFQPDVFALGVAVGALALAATYLLYRAGQLGGADMYVISAIALAVPYLPKPLLAGAQAVPYPFVFSVLAPAGIAFILHMLARFVPYLARRISAGEVRLGAQRAAGPVLLLLAFAFFIFEMSSLPIRIPMPYVAILSFLFVSLFFFTLFKDEIKDSMVENLQLRALRAEDVLAVEKMDRELVKKLELAPLMSEKMIAAMKKARLKSAPVYTDMPFFLPYLFFGLLFTILFGDLIVLLMGL